MDPTFPLITIVNVLCILLILSLFITKTYQTWNIGTRVYAVALIANCLVKGVSPAIWRDNVRNSAPVWCDISIRLLIGSEFAIAACSLSIARYLYRITRFEDLSRCTNKRLDLLIDLSLCIGLPIVFVTLYYAVQPNRYTIREELGCVGNVYPCGFTILLVIGGPLFLAIIPALYYCPLSIWVFYRKRREINKSVSTGRGVSRGHYVRVLALAIMTWVQSTFLLVESTVVTAATLKFVHKLPFWPPRTIHSNWSFIPIILKGEWASSAGPRFGIRWEEWNGAGFAMLFFLIYGLTETSRGKYADCFWEVVTLCWVRRPEKQSREMSEIVFTTLEIHPQEFSAST